jgi:hypothetical protein
MNFKELYTFKTIKEEVKDVIETSKNEKDEEIKIVKQEKVSNSIEFALKKPNRSLFDEAELFYGVKLAESIKAGMLTKTLMLKKYDNDGGIFTKNEVDRIKDLLVLLAESQRELIELEEKNKNLKFSKEDEEKSLILNQKIDSLKSELVEIENNKNNLFEQTAENRAKNKTMMWWVLNLAYQKVGENFIPFFGEGNYEQKLRKYDELEEGGDEFVKKIMTKFAYFISFWYSGRASKKEDFETIEKYLSGEESKKDGE